MTAYGIHSKATQAGCTVLDESAAKRLLAAYGVPARRIGIPLFDEIPELAKAPAAVAHLVGQLAAHKRARMPTSKG